MKRIFILTVALMVVCGMQAQLKPDTRSVSKDVSAVQTQKNGKDSLHKINQEQNADKEALPSPKMVMKLVADMPNHSDFVTYYSHGGDGKAVLNLEKSKVEKYKARLGEPAITGFKNYMKDYPSMAIYSFDKMLLEVLGIDVESYQKLSAKERMEINKKYADQMLELYKRTNDRLSGDNEYYDMLKQFEVMQNDIEEVCKKADATCRKVWEDQFVSKKKFTDADMDKYYSIIIPTLYEASVYAVKIRSGKQFDLAQKIDKHLSEIFTDNEEGFSGFFSYTGYCAALSIDDVQHLLTVADPRKVTNQTKTPAPAKSTAKKK